MLFAATTAAVGAWFSRPVTGGTGTRGGAGEIEFDRMSGLMVACIISSAAVVVLVLPLILRDWLLRRRLRSVLRGTGVCSQCRHSLVGLPVPESLEVTCPECGFTCRVDLSLSELALDAAGREVGRRVVFHKAPFWTRERRRRWLRVSLIVAGSLAVVIGVPLGIHEWRVRRSVAAAVALIPTKEDITELIRIHRPGVELRPTLRVHRLITDLDARVREIEETLRPEALTPGAGGSELGFCFIAPSSDELEMLRDGSEHQERSLLEQALALSVLERVEQEGLAKWIESILAEPLAVQDHGVAPAQIPSLLLPSLGPSRSIARMLAARLRLAVERRDTETAIRSLEAMLALARSAETQSLMIDRLVGVAIRSLAESQVLRWLASHPSEEEIDAIERALDAWPVAWDPLLPIRVEALIARSGIGEFYSDPWRARLAGWVPSAMLGANPWWSGGGELAAGTLEANRADIEARLRAAEAAITVEPFERGAAVDGSVAAPPDAGLSMLVTPGWTGCIRSLDLARTRERQLRTVIAIERWRVRHGEYPESLEALVPECARALPIDPYSGRPFGYRRVDPEADLLGRPYLLWTVGADGRDDGGNEHIDPRGPLPFFHAPWSTPEGYDLPMRRASPIPRRP